jgi:hypothetical protein
VADGHLRELERAAAQGGLEAMVALFREKLRLGLLTADQILLGAYCGDEAARTVNGECPACEGGLCLHGHEDQAVEDGWADLVATGKYGQACCSCRQFRPWPKRLPQFTRWLKVLERWDGALLRGALTAALVALGTWEEQEEAAWDELETERLLRLQRLGMRGTPASWPGDPLPRGALEAVQAYIDCPCDEHKEACAAATHVDLIGAPTGEDDWWRRVCTAVWMEDARTTWSLDAIVAACRVSRERVVRPLLKEHLATWVLNDG